MPNIEITLPDLLTDSDWAQVFADENSGNVDKTVEAAPPGSLVSLDPVSRSDVKEIIAAVNGMNDGANWAGVFLLHDGRYLFAEGGCDYTGWDCQAHNSLTVTDSMTSMLRFGLSQSDRERLGLRFAESQIEIDLDPEKPRCKVCGGIACEHCPECGYDVFEGHARNCKSDPARVSSGGKL